VKMTNNFYYKEAFVSTSFPDLADKAYDRESNNVMFQQRFKKLCQEVLQPARDFVGKPIKITSGYRDKFLNQAVGGSPTSDHQLFLACDIVVPDYGINELNELYIWLKDNTCYRQLIKYPTFIHCSVNDVDIVPFQHRAWIK
jgi:uncharacterized protein YcbK (DUF882 family)